MSFHSIQGSRSHTFYDLVQSLYLHRSSTFCDIIFGWLQQKLYNGKCNTWSFTKIIVFQIFFFPSCFNVACMQNDSDFKVYRKTTSKRYAFFVLNLLLISKFISSDGGAPQIRSNIYTFLLLGMCYSISRNFMTRFSSRLLLSCDFDVMGRSHIYERIKKSDNIKMYREINDFWRPVRNSWPLWKFKPL